MTPREKRLAAALNELLTFVAAPAKCVVLEDGRTEATYVRSPNDYARLTQKCRAELREVAVDAAADNKRRSAARNPRREAA